MNYVEIVQAAKAYADRQDLEVDQNVDVFIMMAEARINRKLKVRKQSHRITTRTFSDQEYYSLPDDYAGMRSITLIIDTDTGKQTKNLTYIPPNEFNVIDDAYTGKNYYTIVADQIRLYPTQSEGDIEIVFYRRVPNLSDKDGKNTNWLSDDHPDIYLSGIITEIESFVKNYDAAQLWDSKMSRSIQELDDSDVEERWAGGTLTMRVE